MKTIRNISIVVISFLFLTAFNNSTIFNLKVDNVHSLQVVRNIPGPHNRDELGREEIAKVVSWLHSSKETKVTGEFGRRPTVLYIKMSDGKLLAVTHAVKWVHINNPDGSGVSNSSYIQDEILITFGSKRIQVKSQDLFNFLTDITYVNS